MGLSRWNRGRECQESVFNVAITAGVVLGQVGEVELVCEVDDHVRLPAAAFKRNRAFGLYQPENRMVVTWITHWLQPGVVVVGEVAVVVETFVDYTELVMNAVAGDSLPRQAPRRRWC